MAARADITRAVIYQHFGDLAGLLEKTVDRETNRARAQLSETVPGDLSAGDPNVLVVEALRAFLHAVASHPVTWRLVLMCPDGAPETLHSAIATGRARVLAQMTEAVEPVLIAGEASPDTELTARMFSAISDEYARLVLTDPERFHPDRLVRHAGWLVRLFGLRPADELLGRGDAANHPDR